MSLGRLSSFLGFRLRRVQNQLSRDFSARTRAWGLRQGMFSALEVIAANPDISQTNLSREVGLDKSVMVAMVDDLEARGWVKRTRSTNDRRRYKLAITPAGQDTLVALFAELETTEEVGLAALTEDERRIVNEALDKVYRAYVRPQQPVAAKE